MIVLTLEIAFESGSLVGTGEHNQNVVAINLPSAFNNAWCAILAPKCKGGAKVTCECFVNEPDTTVGRNNWQFLRPTDEYLINNGIDPVQAAEVETAIGNFSVAKLATSRSRQERRALWS